MSFQNVCLCLLRKKKLSHLVFQNSVQKHMLYHQNLKRTCNLVKCNKVFNNSNIFFWSDFCQIYNVGMYTHVYNFDDDRFCNNFINFLTKQDVPMIVQGSNHYDACQVNDAYVQVLILIQCRYVLSPCMDINRAPNVFLWRNYKICLVNLRK